MKVASLWVLSLSCGLSAQASAIGVQGAASRPASALVGAVPAGEFVRPGLAGKFGSRPRGRVALAKGNMITAVAIEGGLEWLKAHQDVDGHWDAEGFAKHDPVAAPCDGKGLATKNVRVTALALLAFLGDGETARVGPYADVVAKAGGWLVAQQALDGALGDARAREAILDHAIATWALCEASGISGAAEFGPPVQKALDWLERHRRPGSGWGLSTTATGIDAETTCWCVMAAKSGGELGFRVDRDCLGAATKLLAAVTATTVDAGQIEPGPEAGIRQRITAAALLAHFFLGEEPAKNPNMLVSASQVLAVLPKPGMTDLMTCHWASHALYQMGGRWWAQWSRTLTNAVVMTQRLDGASAGSWDPDDGSGCRDEGRVAATALAVLSLESYYRFTKIVR